jgi:hypothetical protein
LTAGTTNTLEWSYVKDAFGSSGLDAAFIDDVNVPPIIGVTGPVFSAVLHSAVLQLQRQTDGKFFIDLAGQNCEEYIVQTSTNLVNWQSISTNFAIGDGIIYVLVPSNGTKQAQFYRAIVP